MYKAINVYLITLYIFISIPCYSQNIYNSNYFPIHIGNTWYYDYPTPQSNPWAMKIIRDSLCIDDLKYYTWTYGDGVNIVDTLRADTSGNVWKYFKGNEYLWFDFSKDSGATYTYELPASFGDSIYYYNVYVITNISTETPAGVFDNCIRLFFDIPQVKDEEVFYTFAPNVGLVIQQNNGWSTKKLTSAIIDGNHITSAKEKIHVPKELVLHQNYPNPFNPVTTIEFYLPKTTNVTLKVFNILGEEVATLVSDRLSAGTYSYDWDASNMASGVYLYRLEVGDFVETRKMVLMR